ncbi:MAG: hypothetical protein WCC82_02215 [Nitrososphaeraceae archaeon]
MPELQLFCIVEETSWYGRKVNNSRHEVRASFNRSKCSEDSQTS